MSSSLALPKPTPSTKLNEITMGVMVLTEVQKSWALLPVILTALLKRGTQNKLVKTGCLRPRLLTQRLEREKRFMHCSKTGLVAILKTSSELGSALMTLPMPIFLIKTHIFMKPGCKKSPRFLWRLRSSPSIPGLKKILPVKNLTNTYVRLGPFFYHY